MGSRHTRVQRRIAFTSLVVAGAVVAGCVVAALSIGRSAPVPSQPVGGASDPCSHPLTGNAAITATLQVVTRGVDDPTLTATTEIIVPESWPGAADLFEQGSEQGAALACFMPVNDYNFQPDPPDITIRPKTKTSPAQVDIVNVVTTSDTAELGWGCQGGALCWRQGLWEIVKTASGYQVTFDSITRQALLPGISWTVKLQAPGWTVRLGAPEWTIKRVDSVWTVKHQEPGNSAAPTGPPVADNGQGTLVWTFPRPATKLTKPRPPSSSQEPQEPSAVTATLTGSWPVDMNLASDRWWPRWLFDTSWQLGGNLVLSVIALLLSWRLRRRWKKAPDKRGLANVVLGISALSIACSIWYIVDDYLWHYAYNIWYWACENMLLAGIGALYFVFALGLSRTLQWWAVGLVILLASLGLAFSNRWSGIAGDWGTPYGYSLNPAATFGQGRLLIDLIPLLTAVTLANAGTVLWICRMWPFGKKKQQGPVRARGDTPFSSGWSVITLLAGLLVLSVLIVGQSAASSYYYWAHSDLWRQLGNPFDWIAVDLLNDGYWWLSDGIGWPLYFALFGGIFALLYAMNGDDARGVFILRDYMAERGDLWLIGALVGCLFIGTWGHYDGLGLPLPFIVAFAGLLGWAFTRQLSKLDSDSKLTGRWRGRSEDAGSLLVRCRPDLLAASEARPDAGPGPRRRSIPLQSVPGGTLELAAPVDPGVTAVALGPAATWWENGLAAVRVGGYLAIGPIAFDVFTAWNSGSVSLLYFPFGLQDAVGDTVSTALAWVSGLFLFGVLVPYLRGIRTPVKGLVFGLVAFAAYAADAGVRHALAVSPYPTFVVDGMLAVVVFTTTGLLLDMSTLRAYDKQGLMGAIYRLGTMRLAVTYVATLIVVGISVWQAIYLANQTAQQRAQNISTAAQYTQGAYGGR